MRDAGVELWGWHVSFCATPEAARQEAELALQWVERHELDGLVLDLEKTPENPRFQGGPREAEIYAGRLAEGLAAQGRGIALSTHDQPSLHPDAPLETALGIVEDVTPQVYYRSTAVARRFKKSLRDYEALIGKDAIKRRYKPTGNITTGSDVRLKDPAVSVAATRNFLAARAQDGLRRLQLLVLGRRAGRDLGVPAPRAGVSGLRRRPSPSRCARRGRLSRLRLPRWREARGK